MTNQNESEELEEILKNAKLGKGHNFSNFTNYDLYLKDWRIGKVTIKLLVQAILDALPELGYVKKSDGRISESEIVKIIRKWEGEQSLIKIHYESLAQAIHSAILQKLEAK